MGLLLNGTGTLTIKVVEKAEIPNASLLHSLLPSPSLREALTHETTEKTWKKEYSPLAERNWVRDH